MVENRYFFGSQLAKRLDYYAPPRSGSHFLWNCFTGLLDLVFFENEFVDQPEAVQRLQELDPHVLYGLRLRANGVPYQPVWINPDPHGLHGIPQAGAHPVLILIRDPFASIYSFLQTATQRWGVQVDDKVGWTRERFAEYRRFFEAAWTVHEQFPQQVCLVRFEDLKKGPEELHRICQFVGVTPKLRPEHVFWLTQFARMAKPGQRTFYRSGDNERWKEDAAWQEVLTQLEPGDFSRFGY